MLPREREKERERERDNCDMPRAVPRTECCAVYRLVVTFLINITSVAVNIHESKKQKQCATV